MQQAGKEFDAAERVAYFVRDTGQHHLLLLVALRNRFAHVVNRLGKKGDLAAS